MTLEERAWEDLSPEEKRAILKAEFEAEVERSKAMRGIERRDWQAQIRQTNPYRDSSFRSKGFGS